MARVKEEKSKGLVIYGPDGFSVVLNVKGFHSPHYSRDSVASVWVDGQTADIGYVDWVPMVEDVDVPRHVMQWLDSPPVRDLIDAHRAVCVAAGRIAYPSTLAQDLKAIENEYDDDETEFEDVEDVEYSAILSASALAVAAGIAETVQRLRIEREFTREDLDVLQAEVEEDIVAFCRYRTKVVKEGWGSAKVTKVTKGKVVKSVKSTMFDAACDAEDAQAEAELNGL